MTTWHAATGRAALLVRRVQRVAVREAVFQAHPHLRGFDWDPLTSTVDYARLRIGHRSSIGGYAYVSGPVTFGDHVMIAMQCAIIAGDPRPDVPDTAIPDAASRDSGQTEPEGIVIENDVWIAHGVIVTGAVRIGAGSVIAGGSIVTQDIPPMVVAAGSPCRPLRDRFPDAQPA
jgi:acetyltransferase-like isoleucine patch superfamily enzyme